LPFFFFFDSGAGAGFDTPPAAHFSVDSLGVAFLPFFGPSPLAPPPRVGVFLPRPFVMFFLCFSAIVEEGSAKKMSKRCQKS
jgi:hypothetical protein